MIEKLIVAGYGGQGILTVGKFLAQCALEASLHVTYLPSYGSEVRGGTANCSMVFSDAPICSPVVETADSLFIMNEQSFRAFSSQLKPGGLLVVNSSLIPEADIRKAGESARVISVDATNAAVELGSIIVANIILTGAYVAAKGFIPLERISRMIESVLQERKASLINVNKQALQLGAAEAIRQQSGAKSAS